MQDAIDRLDRRSAGYSYVHNASTLQWQDHKERETDQRYVSSFPQPTQRWLIDPTAYYI